MFMDEQRLIDLEIKLSYQEVQMEELQKVVNDQYMTMERLEKALKTITDRIKTEDSSANPEHQKPPHY